jgi:hypothetical protein
VPVKYNTIVDLYAILLDRGRTDAEVSAIIVAGDVKLSKDGGTFTNLITLPVISPVGGSQIKISLSATECQCKIGMIRFKDQTSPAEWEEQTIVFYTYGNVNAYDTRDFTTQQSLINAVWDETLTSANHNTLDSAGQKLRRTYETKVVSYGIAQVGTANTITLAGNESSVNEIYTNATITIVSGTGVGQTRSIKSYNGITKVIGVSINWSIIPDATSTYVIQAVGSARVSEVLTAAVNSNSFAVNAIDSTAIAASAVDEIVDQVWSELRADHTIVGSFGEGISSVQGDVTGKVLGNGISNIVGTGVRSSLEDNAITSSKIAANAIGETQIANNTITSDKIANSAITSLKIADNIITSSKIAADAIGAAQIAANAITSSKIAVDAITSDQLSSDAILEISDSFANAVWDEVRADHVIVGSFGEGITSVKGDVSGKILGNGSSSIIGTGVQASLHDDAITSSKIATNAIGANQIASGAIGATQIAANAITSLKIADSAITSTKIAVNAIGADQIANAAITSSKFANDAIDSNVLANSAILEIVSNILVNPANKLLTDSNGKISLIPAESITLIYGQAQTGSVNTLRLAVGFSTVNDLYKGAVIRIYSGTGSGQIRMISSYNGLTGDITVNRNWVVNPDNTSLYSIISVDMFLTSYNLANGAITSNVIANNAIGNSQIANTAISASKFAVGAIDSNSLDSTAVNEIASAILIDSANKILTNNNGHITVADNSITASKIAANAIGPSQIAANAIGSSQIAANAIGNSQIANSAISANKFAANAIDSNAFATDTVNEISSAILLNPTNKLLTDANGKVAITLAESIVLTSGQAQSGGLNIIALASGYSSVNDIYKGAIVKIYSGTGEGQIRSIITYNGLTGNVTVDRNWVVQPDASSLYSIIAVDATISSGNFTSGAITSNAIANNAIGNLQIADNAISATKITNSTITSSKFATDALDANALAVSAISEITNSLLVNPANKLSTDSNGHITLSDNSLTVNKIANNAISSDKIAANAIGALQIATDGILEIAIAAADAVWDEQRSQHITLGSFGEGVNVELLNNQAKSDVNQQVDIALIDYDLPNRINLSQTQNDITNEINNVSDKIGSPISLDGGDLTLSGMLTKMADDSNGTEFDSTYNSLATLVTQGGVNVENIAKAVWNVEASQHIADDTFGKQVNDSRSLIGSPVSLDGSAATIGGMLTKMADDADGTIFNSKTDSLKSIRNSVVPVEVLTNNEIINSGIIVVGNHIDTHSRNGMYFRLTPTGADKLNAEFVFIPGAEKVPTKLTIYGRYQTPDPIAGKFIDVFVYNYNTLTYQKVSSIENRIYPNSTDMLYSFFLNVEHINFVAPYDVRIRLISNDTNIASNFYLDYIGLFVTSDISAALLPSDISKSIWTYKTANDFSYGSLLNYSSSIYNGSITQVIDAKTFKLSTGPTSGTAWNNHVLIYQDLVTNERQCAPILTADAAGNVVLYRNLTILPKVGDSIIILNEIVVNEISQTVNDKIIDGVWNEQRSQHITLGSFGEGVSSVKGDVTGDVIGNVIGSIGSLSISAQSNVKSKIDQSLNEYDSPTKVEMDASFTTLRGPDNDTLKTISDQLDNITTTVNGISNVTRLTTSLPSYMNRPQSTAKPIRVEVALKDENGTMEDPDSQLTVQVFDTSGNSYNINLYKDSVFSAPLDLGTGTFTAFRKLVRSTTGIYYFFFRLESNSPEIELIFKFGWEENSYAIYEYRGSQIVDAANDISAILTTVTNIKSQTDKLRFDIANRVEADAEAISASTLAADRLEANISNLNATISSRSTLNSNDIQTASANAILAVPTNKLKTDVSGRIEISGTKNTIDTLNNVSVSDILNGMVDVRTVKEVLEILLAFAKGRIIKSGSSFLYHKQDNTTNLFTITATPNERTSS